MTDPSVGREEAQQLALSELAVAPAATSTNFFRPDLPSTGNVVHRTRETLLILAPERDFHRLYYVTRDLDDLRDAARRVSLPGDIVAAHLSKGAETDAGDALEQAGYRFYAEYRRMRNDRIRPYAVSEEVAFAGIADADAIESILLAAFDRYTDHLPAREALHATISRREVLLSREADGSICGLVVFPTAGNVANFNYLYSRCSNALATMRMLHDLYGTLHQRGIRRGVLWANVKNQSIIGMHRRFGWKEDGMQARYYLRTS